MEVAYIASNLVSSRDLWLNDEKHLCTFEKRKWLHTLLSESERSQINLPPVKKGVKVDREGTDWPKGCNVKNVLLR